MIIIISCSKNNPNNPTDNKLPLRTTSVNFDEVFLKFETDNKTVPTFTFFKDDGTAATGPRQWTADNDGTNTCYIYNAPDGESGNQMPSEQPSKPFPINGLKVYVYRGINPFEKVIRNDIEKQFYFYRYIGKLVIVAGMLEVDLDNFLVAVDTKTGYVFPYAVPEKWSALGSPAGWISAELGRTGDPNGGADITFEAHKFWQYDPIGVVNDDGTVTLYDFYITAQGNSDYKPRYTGTSPYRDIQ
ncbi:hypothetical protein Bint_0163 [Brachyspira intermedia PWS/A]|uniref:Uncharacterized protein n=2 Tax=Brachyspira intermedia TaxID=84377 RepID=G0EQ92_BRAIP|nr:hypothetical protein Bint_0163 [Brachyspira intermedia PWS/A]